MSKALAGALLSLASCAATLDPLDAAGAAEPVGSAYAEDWDDIPDRPWPGRAWYANRLQDWRVRDGRLECVSSAANVRGRSARLLTHDLARGFRVRLAPVDAGPLAEDALAGLLIGAGEEGDDPRRAALVQQVPAPGGGLLAAVEADGRLVLRDFSTPLERSGTWTLPGGVDFRELPLLAASEDRVDWSAGPVELSLTAGPGVSLRAESADGSVALLTHGDATLGASLARRGISLFSAGGAVDSDAGFAFDDLAGGARRADAQERAFGPVLGVLYTVHAERDGSRTLRLNVQLPLLASPDQARVRLVLEDGQTWGDRNPLPDSWTVAFALGDIGTGARRFRVETDLALAGGGVESHVYTGRVRAEPSVDAPMTVGTLSCVKNQVGPVQWNARGLWFPHEDLARSVELQDPDLLFFAGDQIYEGDITGPDRRSIEHSIADYHTKWQRFLWSFGDLTRERPTITVPDDHDVFHGNLWGAGGVRAEARDGLRDQDAGGYKMPVRFVNAVHATLTSHLPPPRVPERLPSGITTYTTRLCWGGLDCAILADRMWKDSPSVAATAGDYKNGWPQAEGYDPRSEELADAQLLGPEQEAFLAQWADERRSDAPFKLALSQSPFACLHTLPDSSKSDAVVGRLVPPAPGGYPPDDQPVSDADSNGWPRVGRDRAVRLLARAGALHLAGDQHLGTVAWYGLDDFRDGTLVFTNPAMANTWPRRWMPAAEGANRRPTAPRYTGDFIDGFGNRVSVLAAANPQANGREPLLLCSRAPGFGILRFSPQRAGASLEAWPRWADSTDPAWIFPGWPLEVDGRGRPAVR